MSETDRTPGRADPTSRAEQQDALAERRRQVVMLHLARVPAREIARRLSVPAAVVRRDIAVADAAWAADIASGPDAAIRRELATLDADEARWRARVAETADAEAAAKLYGVVLRIMERRSRLLAAPPNRGAPADSPGAGAPRDSDRLESDILAALRASAGGCSRTAIRDALGRHARGVEVSAALDALAAQGLARVERRVGARGGRRAEVWFAVDRSPGSDSGADRSRPPSPSVEPPSDEAPASVAKCRTVRPRKSRTA